MIKLIDLLSEVFDLPDVVYHATNIDFDKFDVSKSNYRGLIYFTVNKNFAKKYADEIVGGDKPVIMYHCELNVNKVFDPEDIDSLNLLKPIIQDLVKKNYKDSVTGKDYNPSGVSTIFIDGKKITNPSFDDMVNWNLWLARHGSWRILEGENILNYIKKNGYDALITYELNAQNIAVFDADKVKILKKEYI